MAPRKGPRRADKLKYIPIDRLQQSSFQPRRGMDGIALKKLAESIRSEGVLQPLFVRKVARGRYEIVAGERRWQAARIAGLEKVPALVRDVSDKTALAIALVENLRREDLNPIDQAVAIRRLIEQYSMTHQEVAATIGRSRATVSNLLRLLLLPSDVKAMVADGRLDMGHARALLALPSEERLARAEQVVAGKIPVRQVERMVKHGSSVRTPADNQQDLTTVPEPERLQSSLEERLGRDVGLKRDKHGRWRLNIAFGDVDELRFTLRAIEGVVDSLESASPNQAEGTANIA